jgi:hypothetical protein
MLNGEWGKSEAKQPRDFTLAERRQRFVEWTLAYQNREQIDREAEGWHEIDDALTPNQIAALPKHPEYIRRSDVSG